MSVSLMKWTDFLWVDFLINTSLKATLVIVLGLMLVRAYAKIPSKQRYLISKGVFVLLLCIPLAGWLPTITLESVSANKEVQHFIIDELPVPYEVAYARQETNDAPTALSAEVVHNDNVPLKAVLNLPLCIFIVWITGFALLLIPVLLEMIYFRRIIQKDNLLLTVEFSVLLAQWQKLLQSATKQMKIDQPVKLVLSQHIKVPAVFGRKHICILMPAHAKHWDSEKIETIFLHELGHVRQKDFSANLLIQFVKALYWWHPLIWWLAKENRLACEQSCDELVLNIGISNFDYARHLVEIARSIHYPRFHLSSAAIPVTQNSQLKKRVHLILKSSNEGISGNLFSILKVALFLIVPVLFLNFNYAGSTQSHLSEQQLIQQLSKPDVATRIDAAKMLGDLQSSAAFVPLVHRLKDKNPKVRIASAWALGKIKNKDAVPELLSLIQDQNDDVKEWALLSLGEFGMTSSFYSIQKMQKHPSPEVRKATLWSLHQIGCLPAFHHISQHLNDHDAAVRHLANQLLHDFPKEKLRNWMINSQGDSYNEWVYEHYTGMKKLGQLNLFIDRLGKNANEKLLLQQVVRKEQTINVLDGIWGIID